MPPPRIPTAAAWLAVKTGTTVIEITQRQGTSVSVSDVMRGVHKALDAGLTVIDHNFMTTVCDIAHANAVHGDGHKDGFCPSCAAIHVAVNQAIGKYREVPD